jgi:hypothetical protein
MKCHKKLQNALLELKVHQIITAQTYIFRQISRCFSNIPYQPSLYAPAHPQYKLTKSSNSTSNTWGRIWFASINVSFRNQFLASPEKFGSWICDVFKFPYSNSITVFLDFVHLKWIVLGVDQQKRDKKDQHTCC